MRFLFLLFSLIPVQMPRHSLTLRVVEFVLKENLECERQCYRLWNWFWKCYQTKPGSACPCSTANLLTSSCEGKCGIYCRASSKESRKLVLKSPELLEGFQGKIFKDRMRERGLWGAWSADGHSSDVFGSQHHQLSGSSWSGVYVRVGIIPDGGFSIC